jgi:hypothetical protein
VKKTGQGGTVLEKAKMYRSVPVALCHNENGEGTSHSTGKRQKEEK